MTDMKNLFEYWDLEKTFLLLAVLAILSGIVISIVALTSDHSPQGYYLQGSIDDNGLLIKTEFNWCEDGVLQLDRSVTYEEAVKIVSDLNKALK